MSAVARGAELEEAARRGARLQRLDGVVGALEDLAAAAAGEDLPALDAAPALEARLLSAVRALLTARCGRLNKVSERIYVLGERAAAAAAGDADAAAWEHNPVAKGADIVVRGARGETHGVEHKCSMVVPANNYTASLNLDVGVAYRRAGTPAEAKECVAAAVQRWCAGARGRLVYDVLHGATLLARHELSAAFLKAYLFAYLRRAWETQRAKGGQRGVPLGYTQKPSKLVWTTARCAACGAYHRFEYLGDLDARHFGGLPAGCSVDDALARLSDAQWAAALAPCASQCAAPPAARLAGPAALAPWEQRMLQRAARAVPRPRAPPPRTPPRPRPARAAARD